MPRRIAQRRDLPSIASTYAAAFWDEEVMGKLMHPYRQEHPQDFLRYWRYEVAEWYWSYSHQIVVSYETMQTSDGDEEQLLTGVADWIRHGEGWERLWGIWAWWDPRNLSQRLVALGNRVSRFFYPNLASDPAMSEVGSVVHRLTSHFWSGPRSSGWYLNFLAVHPDFQNRGNGSSLAKWGIERAREENVTASVISGVGRDLFYRRCGFDVEVGEATDGDRNPLKGRVDGGTVLFRDLETG
ncbi:MAG: hypothetical protein L6R42_010318 [Xanthoria sp. 1 TBL-2021]|nr:MAG: hypothetical protein L6R42_010318 [Xanthoria sp. 1 TBL-2021]